MTAEEWNLGIAAKVLGTKALHEATRHLSLDFFVMITSVESIVALATQSAYTAANNFQEAFARYRRRLGLVASTASFPLVSDVGHLSTNDVTLASMARNKVPTVTEYQFLRLLEPVFLSGKTGQDVSSWSCGKQHDPLAGTSYQAGLNPAAMIAIDRAGVQKGDLKPLWYSEPRVSSVIRAFEDAKLYGSTANGNEANASGDLSTTAVLRRQFHEALKDVTEDNSADLEVLVSDAMVKAVAEMLFMNIAKVSADRAVAHYGVDSLVAAELRHWFRSAFDTEISLLDLLDSGKTMEDIAKIIVQSALQKLNR